MSTNQTFLDLPDAPRSESMVSILPLPVDLTTCWKRGTDDGPAAILTASHHIETWDEELDAEFPDAVGGITTLPLPELPTDPAAMVRAVEALAATELDPGRLLVGLGGEHTVTAPLVRAHRRLWPELCVVQIDAHADIRDTYMGTPHNHACPMRRIVEEGTHVTGIGIRSVDVSEREFIASDRSRLHLAHEVVGRLEHLAEEIVDSLPSTDVYLTVDLDGLDPSVVPAVGTPIPGGLGWCETLAFLRVLAGRTHIVGADVVELCPQPGLHHADAAAARLVYKLLGYRALLGRGHA
jgi:agmatinase